MGVVWLTPAMEDSTPRSVRRSINTQPSFTLQGTGQEDLPAAEVFASSTITMPNWQASLGYPAKKTLKKTIEMTMQLCAEPVEMEIREITRKHRKSDFFHIILECSRSALTVIPSFQVFNQLGVINAYNYLFTSPPITCLFGACSVNPTLMAHTRISYEKSVHRK